MLCAPQEVPGGLLSLGRVHTWNMGVYPHIPPLRGVYRGIPYIPPLGGMQPWMVPVGPSRPGTGGDVHMCMHVHIVVSITISRCTT